MHKNFPIFILDYLSYMENIKGKATNTVLGYSNDLYGFLNYLCEFILKEQNKSLESITVNDIQQLTLSNLYEYFIYIKQKQSLKNSTLRHKIACIRSFYYYLCNKAKLIDVNIAKELEYPNILKLLPIYLSLDECIRLLSAIQGDNYYRDYAIITLFLNCGMRVSELVDIRIANIKNNSIRFIGKGNDERIVPMNQACINALHNYMSIRNKIKTNVDILFLSERKTKMNTGTVRLLLKKYLKIAGLNPMISPHKLRHSASMLLYSNGVDILELKNILGHKSITTTEIYTHIDNDRLKDAMNRNPLSKIKRNTN